MSLGEYVPSYSKRNFPVQINKIESDENNELRGKYEDIVSGRALGNDKFIHNKYLSHI